MQSGAGSSVDAAVVVRRLWDEYTWLQQHLPDATIVRRRHVYPAGKLLDVLTVASGSHAAREVCFDVSACYPEWRPTRPCPYCGELLVTAKSGQCRHCFADFHDPANVVYRRGSDYVDQIRTVAAKRREIESTWPGLNDPRAAFAAQFAPTSATADVVVLHFPDQLHAFDGRVFQIGVECLVADGCRGAVCDVGELSRRIWHTPTDADNEQLGLAVARIHVLSRHGVRLVLVRGEALRRATERFLLLENYETEAGGVAGLASGGA